MLNVETFTDVTDYRSRFWLIFCFDFQFETRSFSSTWNTSQINDSSIEVMDKVFSFSR